MNIEKNYGRDGLMIVCAVRYCLGRMTYIVSDCSDWIISNWKDWPDNVKNIIQRDVEEALKSDDEARNEGLECKPLGHDCDRAQWEYVRRLWSKK